MPKPPPESTKTSLRQRLATHAHTRWPDLAAVNVRYRGVFAYVDGQLANGVTLPLCRLRYNGSASIWGFAIYLANRDGYEDSILPSGLPAGSPEEALDCACGLYLNDPTAHRPKPGPRGLPSSTSGTTPRRYASTMSLDTHLFSSRPISLEELRQGLPNHARWHQYGGDELAYEADGWQLLAYESEAVDPADVPAELRELLPTVGYSIGFILEPVGAPEEAITFMAATLAAVGQKYGCVGYDLRTGHAIRYTSRLSR